MFFFVFHFKFIGDKIIIFKYFLHVVKLQLFLHLTFYVSIYAEQTTLKLINNNEIKANSYTYMLFYSQFKLHFHSI